MASSTLALAGAVGLGAAGTAGTLVSWPSVSGLAARFTAAYFGQCPDCVCTQSCPEQATCPACPVNICISPSFLGDLGLALQARGWDVGEA